MRPDARCRRCGHVPSWHARIGCRWPSLDPAYDTCGCPAFVPAPLLERVLAVFRRIR